MTEYLCKYQHVTEVEFETSPFPETIIRHQTDRALTQLADTARANDIKLDWMTFSFETRREGDKWILRAAVYEKED